MQHSLAESPADFCSVASDSTLMEQLDPLQYPSLTIDALQQELQFERSERLEAQDSLEFMMSRFESLLLENAEVKGAAKRDIQELEDMNMVLVAQIQQLQKQLDASNMRNSNSVGSTCQPATTELFEPAPESPCGSEVNIRFGSVDASYEEKIAFSFALPEKQAFPEPEKPKDDVTELEAQMSCLAFDTKKMMEQIQALQSEALRGCARSKTTSHGDDPLGRSFSGLSDVSTALCSSVDAGSPARLRPEELDVAGFV